MNKEFIEQIKNIITRLSFLEKRTIQDVIVVPKLATDPASPVNGQIWYNSTSNVFKCYQNGAVKTFTVA